MHTKTKRVLFFASLFFLLGVSVLLPFAASAAGYTPLENIPFITDKTSFSGYFEGMYTLFLVIVTLGAVFMIVIGGFVYLTSGGNTARIGTAKGIIWNAIVGLILALISWLILNIINPDLTTLNLRVLTPVAPKEQPAKAGGKGKRYVGEYMQTKEYEGVGVHTDASARKILEKNSISVVSSGNCSNQQNKSCTSLDGMPVSTVNTVIQLKRDCGCDVVVSGGTEVGHATHGAGKAVIDIRRTPELNAYLQKQPRVGSMGKGLRPVYSYNGYKVWDEDEKHFHAWDPANP